MPLDEVTWETVSEERKSPLLWTAMYGSGQATEHVPRETPTQTEARIRERWDAELNRRAAKTLKPTLAFERAR